MCVIAINSFVKWFAICNNTPTFVIIVLHKTVTVCSTNKMKSNGIAGLEDQGGIEKLTGT